jgi:hypothetical protein
MTGAVEQVNLSADPSCLDCGVGNLLSVATAANLPREAMMYADLPGRVKVASALVMTFSSAREAENNSMRYVLIIAMLFRSMFFARAESLDRKNWVRQTGIASKSCFAKFRQKFGNAEGHNHAECLSDQTNKEIDTCIGDRCFPTAYSNDP